MNPGALSRRQVIASLVCWLGCTGGSGHGDGLPDAAPIGAPDAAFPADGDATAGPQRVVLFGGYDGYGDPSEGDLADTWIFDGAAWTQVSANTAPGPREAAAMAPFADQVVLFGGNYGLLLDTWTFDGSAWTEAMIAQPPCEQSTMAARGDQLVLEGGPGGPPTYTWLFGGSDWTQTGIASPPERFGAAIATLGDTIVMFGGSSPEETLLDETWIFDGTNWTQWNGAESPPPRTDATLAALGDRLVLFGGNGGGEVDDGDLADTWTFDGTAWTQLTPAASPPARSQAAMATLGDRVVVFGGGAYLNDTWIFDGTTWTEATPSAAPSGRLDAAMTVLAP